MGNVLIVGGAVRDAILGRAPRDVDVLIFGLDEEHQKSLMIGGSDSNSASPDGLHLNRAGDLDVQFCEDPLRHMANYTIGLCKVAKDLVTNETIISEEFRRDVRDKMITFSMNPICSERKQLSHLDRVKAKFPDYGVRFEDNRCFNVC